VIITVESATDPRIAPYRNVGNPRALERAGLFVAEGRLIVRRLLGEARFEAISILVTPPALAALADVLSDAHAWPIYVCNQDVVSSVTGFNFHRGCLALVRRPPDGRGLDVIPDGLRLIALEGVGNPDNIGGLFRVAAAMDVAGVVLDRTCGDPLYRKAIRTSMGAALRVPFVMLDDWLAGLSELRTRGYRLIALTPDPDATLIETLKSCVQDPLVLMLGSEGHGLQPASLAFADVKVRIRMTPGADSLNVVVAGAIALHELRGRATEGVSGGVGPLRR
jgi:tRNA G18 (ribose-2'-O)-methylase SpoU